MFDFASALGNECISADNMKDHAFNAKPSDLLIPNESQPDPPIAHVVNAIGQPT